MTSNPYGTPGMTAHGLAIILALQQHNQMLAQTILATRNTQPGR